MFNNDHNVIDEIEEKSLEELKNENDNKRLIEIWTS